MTVPGQRLLLAQQRSVPLPPSPRLVSASSASSLSPGPPFLSSPLRHTFSPPICAGDVCPPDMDLCVLLEGDEPKPNPADLVTLIGHLLERGPPFLLVLTMCDAQGTEPELCGDQKPTLRSKPFRKHTCLSVSPPPPCSPLFVSSSDVVSPPVVPFRLSSSRFRPRPASPLASPSVSHSSLFESLIASSSILHSLPPGSLSLPARLSPV